MTERESPAREPAHPTVRWLIVVLALETVLVLVGAVLITIGGIDGDFSPMTIALLATTLLIVLGLAFLISGLVRRRRRLLGGVLTWQVLQLGCSIAGFQGLLGPAWIGWVVFVPAVAGLVLCVSRPVVAMYGSRPAAR